LTARGIERPGRVPEDGAAAPSRRAARTETTLAEIARGICVYSRRAREVIH
jgi:hypothetical protein